MIIRWKRKTAKNDLVFHTVPLSADDFSARFCSRTDFVHKIKHQKSEDYIKESQYIRIIWAEHERVLSSFKHDGRKRKNNTSKQIIALARCILICFNPWPRWLSFWNFVTWSRPMTYYTTNYLLWRVIVLLRSCSCRQFQPPVIVHHCVGRFEKRPVRGWALRRIYQQACSGGTRKFRKGEAVRLSR